MSLFWELLLDLSYCIFFVLQICMHNLLKIVCAQFLFVFPMLCEQYFFDQTRWEGLTEFSELSKKENMYRMHKASVMIMCSCT